MLQSSVKLRFPARPSLLLVSQGDLCSALLPPSISPVRQPLCREKALPGIRAKSFVNNTYANLVSVHSKRLTVNLSPLSTTLTKKVGGSPTLTHRRISPACSPLVTRHSPLSFVFSHSSALFCTSQKAISHIFNRFRTLCAKHPGWGVSESEHQPAILGRARLQSGRNSCISNAASAAAGRKDRSPHRLVFPAIARLRQSTPLPVFLSLLFLLSLLPVCTVGQTTNPSPAQALAFEQQGRFNDAVQVWRAVVKTNPSDAAAFASLGVDLSRLQKYPEAAAAYKKALALNPQLPGIPLNLGLAEFKQGHFPSAIAPFQAALAADPSNQQARTLLGISFYAAGQFASAVEQLRTASSADPANTELHRVLAQSCLWAKQFDCALQEFQKILQQNPDSAAAHMLMGEALDGLTRTPEAVAEFQAAAKSNPNEPDLHFGLGYLYWKLKQYDQAEPEFQKELALNPANAQALAYLGDVAMKQNDDEKALALLKKAVASGKDIRIAYLDMGAILTEQGKAPQAIPLLKRAVALDPEQPDAHYRLGRAYQATENQAEAQKEFAKVRELHDKAEADVAHKMSAVPPPIQPQP
jgi:tetratricopeptide (TPR) repeat protein